MTRRRVLFHVQSLLGIGHWRRAMAIARAMQQIGLEVVVLSGSAETPGADETGIEIVRLPAVRAADARFDTILDARGDRIDDAFKAHRRDMVLATVDRVRPHVLLLESFPFGRRAFAFELLPLIGVARSLRPRPAILASVRDVLVGRNDPERTRTIVQAVSRDFDGVLVHGDPELIPLDDSFPAARRIADKLFYTGYVLSEIVDDDGQSGTGEVIVSAGGGAVGASLLRTALAARPASSLATTPWRLLAGPHLPDDDYFSLSSALTPGVALERFRPDFPAMLSRCLLSISQAGYNTTMDIVRSRARAIVVPFAAENETEQTRRAQLLARRGAFHLLPESALDPDTLAAAIAARMADSATAPISLLRDGARCAARAVADFAFGNRSVNH